MSFAERLRRRAEADRLHRERQRERRRARDGWLRVPDNKPTPTLEEVSALLKSPCYEVFRDADGVSWMRRLH